MKAVLDTKLWIQSIRGSGDMGWLWTKPPRPLLHMSSVVAMELMAGCGRKDQASAMQAIIRPFEKAGRVIAPDAGAYLDSGRVLGRMTAEGVHGAALRGVANEVLFALSIHRGGAMLWTENEKDMERISHYVHVYWATAKTRSI